MMAKFHTAGLLYLFENWIDRLATTIPISAVNI
jgi:hypothetical protein